LKTGDDIIFQYLPATSFRIWAKFTSSNLLDDALKAYKAACAVLESGQMVRYSVVMKNAPGYLRMVLELDKCSTFGVFGAMEKQLGHINAWNDSQNFLFDLILRKVVSMAQT
jgi:hypothetical protein